jgi:asparagine synthase (glutamine-hydrolysing)
VFDIHKNATSVRQQILEQSKKLRHRGPDWSGVYADDNCVISHERLAIVDPQSGKQPLYNKANTMVLAVNGEIYNHQQLRKEYPDYEFLTQSDCKVILAMYEKKRSPIFK